jgi:hypothetical protein
MLKINKCELCWFEWIPRKTKRARRCPCCNSLNWDLSGKRLYNFNSVEINERKLIQWVFDKDGLPDTREGNKTLNALKNYEKRTGRKFRREGTTKGLLITRIK